MRRRQLIGVLAMLAVFVAVAVASLVWPDASPVIRTFGGVLIAVGVLMLGAGLMSWLRRRRGES